MPAPKAVRIAALIVGLGILAVVWLIGFVFVWGSASGGFFMPSDAPEPSWVAIAIAVLSYLLTAALLFGERLR